MQRELGCGRSTAKFAWRNKDSIQEWVIQNDRDPSAHPETQRKKGERTSLMSVGSWSKGRRRPKSRGYLVREQTCREFYARTKLWCELEREQGHELWGSDLMRYFVRHIKSELAFASEETAKSELTQTRL